MKKISNTDLCRSTPSEYVSKDKLPVAVVLDNVRSMNNVGSFFRTCDAFTMERILLCGITGTPPNREIHKTALGAEETVEWTYHKDTSDAVKTLIGEGYIPIAVEQVEGAVPLDNFVCRPDTRYALIFGNEVSGVGQSVVDLCRAGLEIPQCGTKHSLNVAVAGGIVLWHFFCALKQFQ